jgi:uncharacterized membrane protein
MMKTRHFLNAVDHDQIVAAIRRVESATHGRVHVFVSHRQHKDVLGAARVAFHRLGMDQLEGDGGVLIYMAPRQKGFAVLGGRAIHERCGDEFWQKLTDEMAGYFREGNFTAGMLHAIDRAGAVLAEYPPAMQA